LLHDASRIRGGQRGSIRGAPGLTADLGARDRVRDVGRGGGRTAQPARAEKLATLEQALGRRLDRGVHMEGMNGLHKLAALFLLAVLGVAQGCAAVAPYERERLAKPD